MNIRLSWGSSSNLNTSTTNPSVASVLHKFAHLHKYLYLQSKKVRSYIICTLESLFTVVCYVQTSCLLSILTFPFRITQKSCFWLSLQSLSHHFHVPLQVKELELGQVIIQQSSFLGTLTPEAQRYSKFSSYAQQAELPVHNVPAGNWAKPLVPGHRFSPVQELFLCVQRIMMSKMT